MQTNLRGALKYFVNQIFNFLTNRQFILNLLGIMAFLFVVIFGVLQWLKLYTHHGQKLELPNYVDQRLIEAIDDAEQRSFQIIVNDSVHIVGKPGGLIQNQNPKGGSLVKQNRKIYVTTTKHQPDIVDIAEILPLYGQDYDMKSAELQRQSISSTVKETKYDPLADNIILEVWQDGEMLISRQRNPESLQLEKGSRLEMVVSTKEGRQYLIPNLVGKSVRDARNILDLMRIRMGSINTIDGRPVDNVETAKIVRQNPEFDQVSFITVGDAVDIVIE